MKSEERAMQWMKIFKYMKDKHDEAIEKVSLIMGIDKDVLRQANEQSFSEVDIVHGESIENLLNRVNTRMALILIEQGHLTMTKALQFGMISLS